MFAEGGARVPLMNIRLCNDAAAVAIREKRRNKRLKKRIGALAAGLGYVVLFTLFLVGSDDDFSWHGIRSTFGFPYTVKEHMHDTSTYYTKTDSDSGDVYTSNLDPVSTALDLIDSVQGGISEMKVMTYKKGMKSLYFIQETLRISSPIRMDRRALRCVISRN
nr:hypothetical protein [Veillonella denticariosi]